MRGHRSTNLATSPSHAKLKGSNDFPWQWSLDLRPMRYFTTSWSLFIMGSTSLQVITTLVLINDWHVTLEFHQLQLIKIENWVTRFTNKKTDTWHPHRPLSHTSPWLQVIPWKLEVKETRSTSWESCKSLAIPGNREVETRNPLGTLRPHLPQLP